MQGVQPAPKTTPISPERSAPACPGWPGRTCTRTTRFRAGISISPATCSPMTISSTPPATRSPPVAGPSERPISPMDAHKAMKTALNPATKLIAFANAAGRDTR